MRVSEKAHDENLITFVFGVVDGDGEGENDSCFGSLMKNVLFSMECLCTRDERVTFFEGEKLKIL